MTLYRKANKIIFNNGNVIEAPFGEYILFDGDHLMIINDEDMSIKFIDYSENEFELIFTHEKIEHPFYLNDYEEIPSWHNIENVIDNNNDDLEYNEMDELFESISTYLSGIQIEEDELSHDIYKKFSIDAVDGDKFQVFFGVDIIRKKIVPFLEIQNKNRKVKKTVFKIYLNKTNIRKIFNSVISLKKILDKEIVELRNKESSGLSKKKENV